MAGQPFSAACVNCMDCGAAMQYNPIFPLGGTQIRSSPRQRSKQRGAVSSQLARHCAPHAAPRSFQEKAAPAAVQTPRFQKIASTSGVSFVARRKADRIVFLELATRDYFIAGCVVSLKIDISSCQAA